ncbi:hypothetical protein OSTOST_12459 [Ostertagia ostertagi]
MSRSIAVQRLSDVEKNTLIEIVRSYPAIWDYMDEQYKNNSVKRLCWMNVSIDMAQHFGRDYDDELLQRIYRNLKDVYQRKRKERNSSDEVCESHRTYSWPFYSTFAYLGAAMTRKKAEMESCHESCEVKAEEQECDEAEEDNIEDTYSNSESPQTSASTRAKIDNTVNGRESPSWHRKRKHPDDVEMMKKLLQKRCERLDRYDALGNLLAVHLKELDQMDPLLAEEFLLKANSLQYDVAAKILELKRRKAQSS